MKTFFTLIFIVAVLYLIWVLWKNFAKHKINSIFHHQRQDLSNLFKDQNHADDLPEKSKQIKQHLDTERHKQAVSSESDLEPSPVLAQVVEVIVCQEDQRLFDEVAQWFFQQEIMVREMSASGKIQHDILSKMPLSTQSQSAEFDGGEWSIFWHYHDQSLEYYVGRYGIFYAHVDREGREHKQEFRHS